jgi:hypothetical protein
MPHFHHGSRVCWPTNGNNSLVKPRGGLTMQTINVRSLLWLFFLRDWPWKLFSFAIAFMIYFSVRSEISNLKTIAVPIMGDGGCVVMSAKPETVHVTLRGSGTELSQLFTPAIYIAVTSHEKQGELKETNKFETVRLKSSALRQIGRLRVVRIDPAFVNVQFDRPTHLNPLTEQQPSN